MGHDHQHGSGSDVWRLGLAVAIAASLFVAQLVGAQLTGSLALLADTAHVGADAIGLIIGLTAAVVSRRPASDRHTWGWLRAEVLGALVQATLLIGVAVLVVISAVERLWQPAEIPGTMLLWFGIIGLAGNLLAFAVLAGGRTRSLNLRAATLEVGADALGSIAVILAAVLIQLTGWGAADSIAAVAIGVLIVPRAVALLRETTSVLLEATPPGLDLEQVRQHLLGVDHVLEVHDLHASRVSTGLPVLTAHVVLETRCFADGHSVQILTQLQECVAEHFPVSVAHSTFQLETPERQCDSAGLHAHTR